jgi:predicted small metal-binding protein
MQISKAIRRFELRTPCEHLTNGCGTQYEVSAAGNAERLPRAVQHAGSNRKIVRERDDPIASDERAATPCRA